MSISIEEADSTPEEARSLSSAFLDMFHRITGQNEDQLDSLKSTATSFDEILSEDIQAAGGINHQHWGEAALACVVVSEAAEKWADDLEWYEEKSAGLRIQATFDARLLSDTPQEGQNESPKETFLASLQTMANENWEELRDDRAENCSQIIRDGTDPDNVANLVNSGRLGWLPYNLLGDEMPVPVGADQGAKDGEELREMIASGEISQEEYAAIMATLTAVNGRADSSNWKDTDLTKQELDYLEALYAELEQLETGERGPGNDGVIALPDLIEEHIGDSEQQRELRSELGTGLLNLSNEQMGTGDNSGGEHRLPESVRQAAQLHPLRELDTDLDEVEIPGSYGADLENLEQLLGAAPSNVEGGNQFSQNITMSMGLLLDHNSSLERQHVEDSTIESMLDVSTRNGEANHSVLTGQFSNENLDPKDDREHLDMIHEHALKNLLLEGESFDPENDDDEFSPHQREPGGFTALFDWLSDERANNDEDTRQLTTESMAALVEFVSEPDMKDELQVGSDGQGLSRDAADSLADAFTAHIHTFGEPDMDPENSPYSPENGTIGIGMEDRLRFMEVLVSDESAAVDVHADSTRFNSAAGEHSIETGNFDEAHKAGIVAGMIDTALDHEAFYRDLENQEKTERRERIYDGVSDLVTGAVSDATPARFTPGVGAGMNLGSDLLKEQVIPTIPPSETHAGDADDDLEPRNMRDILSLQLMDRMLEEHGEDPEEIPDPFDTESGERHEEQEENLEGWGIISDDASEERKFHFERAQGIINGDAETLEDLEDSTDAQSSMIHDVRSVTNDSPLSWIPDSGRTGSSHTTLFMEEYVGGMGDVFEPYKKDSPEEIENRDEALEEAAD